MPYHFGNYLPNGAMITVKIHVSRTFSDTHIEAHIIFADRSMMVKCEDCKQVTTMVRDIQKNIQHVTVQRSFILLHLPLHSSLHMSFLIYKATSPSTRTHCKESAYNPSSTFRMNPFFEIGYDS